MNVTHCSTFWFISALANLGSSWTWIQWWWCRFVFSFVGNFTFVSACGSRKTLAPLLGTSVIVSNENFLFLNATKFVFLVDYHRHLYPTPINETHLTLNHPWVARSPTNEINNEGLLPEWWWLVWARAISFAQTPRQECFCIAVRALDGVSSNSRIYLLVNAGCTGTLMESLEMKWMCKSCGNLSFVKYAVQL